MLTLRERLARIRPLIETTDDVVDLIKYEGFLTGSRAFGVNEEDSDFDIVIKPYASITWDNLIWHYNGVYLHSNDDDEFHYNMFDFKSAYVFIEGKIYNLLFMDNQDEYDRWEYATSRMYNHYFELGFKKDIEDKKSRVALFELYKKEWKKI